MRARGIKMNCDRIRIIAVLPVSDEKVLEPLVVGAAVSIVLCIASGRGGDIGRERDAVFALALNRLHHVGAHPRALAVGTDPEAIEVRFVPTGKGDDAATLVWSLAAANVIEQAADKFFEITICRNRTLEWALTRSRCCEVSRRRAVGFITAGSAGGVSIARGPRRRAAEGVHHIHVVDEGGVEPAIEHAPVVAVAAVAFEMKPGRQVAEHAQAAERDLWPGSGETVDVHAKESWRDGTHGGGR